MPASDKPSAPKPRVNYLRRRPRPGGLVRAPDDLALPHERDQTEEGMTGGIASPDVQQAHRDLERGVKDTSKSPEMDRTYQRQK
ncbi:hypothetical protein [Pseudorhodoferax sp. Leaf267]|uniref:hypothetical protein n=1 Tax=Pseudorhodoferax sp. Leaf267 TaxID=1736316 RepID=UPI000715EF10|nr:hypothetical protein [Pseudorhodoferax sp. Leaf267]KQP11954.1 hypothetical protein ASF43_23715 [Pseudorhodoferax sp. Leaf267]